MERKYRIRARVRACGGFSVCEALKRKGKKKTRDTKLKEELSVCI